MKPKASATEYQIETCDATRAKLPDFLRALPKFLCEKQGAFHFGPAQSDVFLTVRNEEDHAYVCQHIASPETDAMLGLLIRHILSLNDHVLISKLRPIAADAARNLGRAFLRHKSWGGQYLHAAKDVIEVLDRQSHWHVVFRHSRWRSEKPGKGIVAINKRTGASVWRTPRENSEVR